MDRQIAHKAKAGGQKLQSNIWHTKAKVRQAGVNKEPISQPTSQMFPPANKSAIASMQVSSRRKQSHPGKVSHIPWREQAFCQYCNKGFASKCEQGKLNLYLNSHPSRLQIETAPRHSHL
jgi:hypothetical protein